MAEPILDRGDDVATHVTVAIPTFRRNNDLLELIPILVAEVGDLTSGGRYEARVLIIDNDPDGAAESVIRQLGHFPVDYVHEPRPGLSSVRNRAVDESAASRLLAFMDDDGRPVAGWLGHLVETWESERPAAVAGRVLEDYECEPDPWIVAGEFFRRRSLPTGTVVPVAPAGNLLLDLDQIRHHRLRFDARFGLSGGEDTLLTRQITAVGGRIIWNEESQVVDQVPAVRMTRQWVLNRSRSHGNTSALVDQAMAKRHRDIVRARIGSAVGGLARVVGGTIRYGIGVLVSSDRHQARGLRAAYRGAGMMSGAVGTVIQEYSR